MSSWWWVLIGAVIFVILFIIYDKRKAIFKKRTKKEKKATAPKEEKKSKKEINSKIKLEKTQKEAKNDAVVEEVNLAEEKQVIQTVNDSQRITRPPIPHKEDLDDDFDEFRKKHSYTRFLGDKKIAEQIKKLSPEMKAILFGNVLDRKDQ